MKKNLQNKLDEIVNDKIHGAAQVAQHALEFIKVHAKESTAESDGLFLADIELICNEFKLIDNELAPVHNSIEAFLRRIKRESPYADDIKELSFNVAETLLKELKDSSSKIASHFSHLILHDSTIMTISQSSTIVHVLKFNKERIKNVFIMESRPLREGRQQAQELIAQGIPASLIADAACGHFARYTDMVIIGADRILRDGSVTNKVGSYPLALVARENVIPFYVACESIKWDPRCQPESFTPQPKDEVEMFRGKPDNLNIKNIYFERIEPELITKIITEKTKSD
ncbi:MAG: hypothetical protein ABIA63_08935 [bacterium]